MSINGKLGKIEALEKELLRKAADVMAWATSVSLIHLYAVGATNRTVSQSKGFRTLIAEKNFSCAAILLRTQIDTAMRLNGIRFLSDPDTQVGEILSGKITFRRLKSKAGEQMNDAFLRKKLAEEHPWVNAVYEETSDFVHLSFRHLWPAIRSADDETRTLQFVISGEDNPRSDNDYDEICDAFFEASKLTSLLVVALLTAYSPGSGNPTPA